MTGRVLATTPESKTVGESSSSGARWRRVAGSLVRRTPSSLVVSIPAAAAPLRIEGAAALVWESLEAPRTVVEIVAELNHEGAGDADVLASEVARTLDALVEAGLVECG